MADTGITLNSGSGGAVVDTELLATRGFQVQRVKLVLGAVDTDLGDLDAAAKGVQAAQFMPVQQPKDTGRTFVTLSASRVTGVAAETLLTCAQNKGGSTASATSYTVTSGKTLRIQSISATVRGSSTAAAVNGIVNLRSAASSVSTASPLVMTLDVPGIADTSAAGNGNQVDVPIPDGLEIAGGQQIALSQSCSTTSATVSVTLIGFEY